MGNSSAETGMEYHNVTIGDMRYFSEWGFFYACDGDSQSIIVAEDESHLQEPICDW